MGQRIENWDENAKHHWGGGTWLDFIYYGKGSVDLHASHHQSGDVKLMTMAMGLGSNGPYRYQIKSIKLGVSAYGVLVDAYTTKADIDVYGLGWVDLTVRGGYGTKTIKAASPGEVKVRTGGGNDAVSINMGGRYTYIDVSHGDDRIWLSTGIKTEIKKGFGSLEVSGSAYRTGWTTIDAQNLQRGGSIESRSYGHTITVQDASEHIKLSLYGAEANIYELKSGNAKHTIYVSSPGYNTITTAAGDDWIQIDMGGRDTTISTGHGNDTVKLTSGIHTTIYKGDGSLHLSGSAYRSGWTNVRAGNLNGGASLQSSSYGNWVIIERASNDVRIDMYGLEANHVETKSGNANHSINVSSPGYNEVITADGNDHIQIDMGGRNTTISTGNGNDTVKLSSGVNTTISKGDGSLNVSGSAARSSWTVINAGNLFDGAYIQSRSYGNKVVIERASNNVRIDMYGLEANQIETKAGTANHSINVAAPGYNEITTADGNDSIQIDMGGRNTLINPGNGNDWVRVINGINVNIGKRNGSLQYSQDAYLSGVLEVKSETSRTFGESRSYGLRLEVNDHLAHDQSGRWHGYALNWANVFLNTGSNAFYGSFFGGSWGRIEAKGQNYVQMTALQNTVIKDQGGNNYFTTGVQYGAVTVWTSITRESAGATTIDMLGQKLDIYNSSGAGNQFLINNGGIVGTLSFARSGNGLIYGQYGADLSDSISLGQNSNYLYYAKSRKSSFTLNGNKNEIVDLGESATYTVTEGTQNTALLSRGTLDFAQSSRSHIHVMANMSNGAMVKLGKGNALEIHAQIDHGPDSKFKLYRTKTLQGNQFELFCESLDVSTEKSTTRKLLSFTSSGSESASLTLRLGLSGDVTLTNLNEDSTHALPSLGRKSSFKYVSNGAGPDGAIDLDLKHAVSAQQRNLVDAWGAKSLLTLPGLSGSSAISNGNFARGIVDFTSDYVLNDDPLVFKGPGTITLTTQAPNWGFPTREGPSGPGSSFLVVDGSTEAGKSFWSSSVIGLKPGAMYTFEFSMMHSDYHPPVAGFYVNNTAISTTLRNLQATLPNGWKRYSINFLAPLDGGKTRFDLKNLILDSGGNDLGIGNIAINAVQHADGSITNGGFEKGMNGFTSMYQDRRSSDYNNKLTTGTYAFVKKFDTLPDLFNLDYAKPSTGTSDVLWVSGGSDSSFYFLKKSLFNLVSGDEYLFSFKMLGNDRNPPRLVLDVNGVQQSPIWSVKKEQGWVSHSTFIKVPKGSNHLELGMRDLVTELTGNDFAIDDVAITKTLGPSDHIVNGDFESDYLGFTSEYTKGDGAHYGDGVFAVVDAAPGWGLGASKGAGGKGKFLMVDGASRAEKHFWKANLTNLRPGDEYVFGFKMMANDTNPARLKLDVNGVSLDQTWSSSAVDGWVRHSVKISVPAGVNVLELALRDETFQASGNDFGIDDIEIVRITRTPTDQGVSDAWIRGLRLFHAQSPEEIGDVVNMSTHQGFLLANNVFGIEVLKLLDASTISKLNPTFYANVSSTLLTEWARSDVLSAVTPTQISAVPITTVLDLLMRGTDQKMSATTKDVAYGMVASHLDGLDWDSTTPINLAQLPTIVFHFMKERSLTKLKDSKIYDSLPGPAKTSITGQLTAYTEQKQQDENITGFMAAASTFSGLSSEDLNSITNELSDNGIKTILDLKIPAWTLWTYGLPYTAITWQNVFYAHWILGLKKNSASINSTWSNGLSSIESDLRKVQNTELRANLINKYIALRHAVSDLTELTETMSSAATLFKNLRFYASVYRLISAAGVLGVELQKHDQATEKLAFTGLKLAQTIASCLQVPVGFFSQSLINSNIPGSDLYAFSKWDDFAKFWNNKGLFSTLSSIYDLRVDLLSSSKRNLVISSYQKAIDKMKADMDLFSNYSSHSTFTRTTDITSAFHEAASVSKPSKAPTLMRVALPNLMFQCSDLGGLAVSVWGLVNASKALATDSSLSESERSLNILTIFQQSLSALAASLYAIGDAAGFASTLVKLGKLPIQVAKLAALETGSLIGGSVIGMVAHSIEYFMQGELITDQNKLAPALGMTQSLMFLCLEAISLAVGAFGPIAMAIELLMPNLQAAVLTAVMNDRLKLIDEVGSLIGGSPSRYRDGNIEEGYLGSCSVFKSVQMLQRSQFDQMLSASMPLGSITGPIALAAATTTLKNRIFYEPDFSDAPGNSNNAYENFIKTVLAENNIFNIMTSGVEYAEGMSGLIDWGHFHNSGGGKDGIKSSIQSFADLYAHGYRFLLTLASGANTTFPDGNPVSNSKYAVLSNLGIYGDVIKATAPTHMYHESWNLLKISTLDLFAFASRMADIDKNIDPYSFGMICFGLSGERIRLSTHRSAQVNIELIDSSADDKKKVDELYLGEGNFNINVRENDSTSKYTRVYTGTGYSSVEGAQEMYGNDFSDSIFIASTHTKTVKGGSMKGDVLGFSKNDDLTKVNIDDSDVWYSYVYDGTKSLENTVAHSNIGNFVIADKTNSVTINQSEGGAGISLLMAEGTDLLTIQSGHVVTSTTPSAGKMEILLYANSGEVALNSAGNRVTIGAQSSAPHRNDDHYAVSTVVGNQFDVFEASADIAYEIRPINNGVRKDIIDPTLSIIGSRKAINSFSFDLAELLKCEEPVQLHLVGEQTNGGRHVNDKWIDRINFTSPRESSGLLVNASDILFSPQRPKETLFTVAGHQILDRTEVLKIQIGEKTVVEVYSLLRSGYHEYSQTAFDICLDNNLLSNRVIG